MRFLKTHFGEGRAAAPPSADLRSFALPDVAAGDSRDPRLEVALWGAGLGLWETDFRTDFTRWYSNLLTQTRWNFHDFSAIDIKPTAMREFLISFVVDWYGEVKADSDQAAAWQSRTDSLLYHHRLRQTWTVTVRDRLLIEKLIVTGGDTPSPVRE